MHTPATCYFPDFLSQFWLTSICNPIKQSQQQPTLFTYERSTDELEESKRFPPPQSPDTIFDDLFTTSFPLDKNSEPILKEANTAFAELESSVASTCIFLLDSISWGADKTTSPLQISYDEMDALRRYFAFLRFRNSQGYQEVVWSIHNFAQKRPTDGKVYRTYRPYIAQLCRQQMLRSFIEFFSPVPTNDRIYRLQDAKSTNENKLLATFEHAMTTYCWRLYEAEVCIGIAKEQEYILPECCYGLLDGTSDEEYCDFFCPLLPGVSLYILGTASTSFMRPRSLGSKKVPVELGLESGSDIHLRNALILQSAPQRIFFSSKRSVSLSITKFGRGVLTADYSKLLEKCKEGKQHTVSGLPDKIAAVIADSADSGPLVCRDVIYLLRTLSDPVYP